MIGLMLYARLLASVLGSVAAPARWTMALAAFLREHMVMVPPDARPAVAMMDALVSASEQRIREGTV